MEATIKTKAIVLKREPFNEHNSRVFLYTKDFGKLDLVARGTQKISSKLAAHIEPLNLCEIMIIKGKQYDYLGSCVSENVFSRIKNDYGKAVVAGEAARTVDEIVRGEEKDGQIFLMLKKFFEILNTKDGASLRLLQSAFVLKLISLLGYQPKLGTLQTGKEKISLKLANFVQMILAMTFEEILSMETDKELFLQFSQAVNNYKLYTFD